MFSMHACFILPAILILHSAWAMTIEESKIILDGTISSVGLDVISNSRQLDTLLAIVIATKNATSQLQIELDTLRGRQAASAAVQASQVLMLVVYFLTILSIYVVKRCQKVREKAQQKDFELLEKQLRSSRAKRRAAAAKEKSAPAASLE